MASNWFLVLTLVSVFASLVAAIYLLVTLQKLSRHLGVGRRSKGIMARQLWHLACADLIDSLIALPYLAVRVLALAVRVDHSLVFGCWEAMCVVVGWHNVGLMVSLLVEVHIALSTLCAILGLRAPLDVLSRMLVLVWPLGFTLGAFWPLLSKPYWTDAPLPGQGRMHGRCQTKNPEGENFRAKVLLVGLVCCSLTYVLGLWSIFSRGFLAERHRYQGRSGRYLLVAILGWGPTVILWWSHKGHTGELDHVYEIFSAALLGSNGWMNAAMYAEQSHFRRRTLPPPPAVRPLQNFASGARDGGGDDPGEQRRFSTPDVERELTNLTSLDVSIVVEDTRRADLEKEMFDGFFGPGITGGSHL